MASIDFKGKRKRKIIIWGLGEECGKLLDYLKLRKYWKDEIVAFCDNNGSVREFQGITVIKPDELIKYEFDYIIIATIYIKAIKSQIAELYPQYSDFILDRLQYQSVVYSEDQYWIRMILIIYVSRTMGKSSQMFGM